MESITVSTTEFNLFRDLIQNECGIALGDDKQYLIEKRLNTLLLENGCTTFREFYDKIKSDTKIKSAIIDAMTTNETLWFRDEAPYITMREKIIPEYLKAIRTQGKSKVRIWSAACSTGQEPYSISILLHEMLREGIISSAEFDRFSIFATDISNRALILAKMLRYDNVSISRGLSTDLRDRYFTAKGNIWQLDPAINKMVTFQQYNLSDSFTHFEKFDIVFLRHVAIYFSPEFKKSLFQRIRDVMNPGGILFLGSTESLMGFSEGFNSIEYQKCVYYQKQT